MSASELKLSAAHLFYALTLSAVATALFGAWGLPVAGFIALVWWQILSGAQRETQSWARESAVAKRNRSGRFKLELAVVLVVSMLLLGLFLPATDESDPMRQAENSMQVVAKAIAAYEQQYGMVLPAVVRDSQGKPLHSWRTLILPQLGENQLAADYHFDEPWNSSNNLHLADARPWHFQTRYPQGDNVPEETSLHIIDLGSERIVVEQESARCNWLEPTSLTLAAWNELNDVPDLEQGFWKAGFFASRFRGRLVVSRTASAHIHPREQVTPFEFACSEDNSTAAWIRKEIGVPVRRYHLDHMLQLGCFLLVVLYPIRWLKRIQTIDSAPDANGR